MSEPHTDLVSTIVTFQAKPGSEDELRALLGTNVAAARSRPGNLTYTLHEGTEDPTVFVLYENWRSSADQEAHSAHPDSRAMREKIGPLVAAPPVRTGLRPV